MYTRNTDIVAVQIGSTLNSEFNTVAHHFKMVRYRGAKKPILPRDAAMLERSWES